jgi:hypothetical protein
VDRDKTQPDDDGPDERPPVDPAQKMSEDAREAKVRELFARMASVKQYPYSPDDDPEPGDG